MRSITYDCGYCGNSVASDYGYFGTERIQELHGGYDVTHQICICPHCNLPTFFSPSGSQAPGPSVGGDVAHIPSVEVKALYDEARACMKVNAHTAAAMCCRKLLMNVAVAEGAKPNLRFLQYADFLVDEGHVTRKAKGWVDHIRKKGNEANHEINIFSSEDAQRLMKFSEMMLRVVYEYPAEAENPS